MEKLKYIRAEYLDRPTITGFSNGYTLPQSVGFLQLPSLAETVLSIETSLALGLVGVGEVSLSKMPVEDWIELQIQKEREKRNSLLQSGVEKKERG